MKKIIFTALVLIGLQSCSSVKEYEKEKAFKPTIDQIYELNKVYDAMQLADASNKEFLNKLAAAVAKIRNGLVK